MFAECYDMQNMPLCMQNTPAIANAPASVDYWRITGNPYLIWCDPVNIFESLGWFLHLSFRGQDQQQPRQVMATIDQADIRGSEPHNHDPSGAASD
jgi:hypothetical protein